MPQNKNYKYFLISSFTTEPHRGNPAGVVLLDDKWLSDDLMQKIASTINLSETAFVKKDDRYHIRWFTPTVEVDLCGHGTLASAHAIGHDEIIFHGTHYTLPVYQESGKLVLDFPIADITEIDGCNLKEAFDTTPIKCFTGNDEYMLIFENQSQIENIKCNMDFASKIDKSGFIITAPSNENGVDFVSRYFAPKIGINEDPVTGSAHTLLVPYWKSVMNKNTFFAKQISPRGGELFCRIKNNRVHIGGNAVTFIEGFINLC